MYKFKTTTNDILHFEFREDIIIGIQKKHDGPYLVLLDSNLKLKDEVKKQQHMILYYLKKTFLLLNQKHMYLI